MLPSPLSKGKSSTPTNKGNARGNMGDAAESALLYAPHTPAYGAKAAYFIEQMAGDRPWWNVLLFEWFSPLMALGNTRRLHTADLFPLCDAHRAAAIAPRLEGVWADAKARQGKHASLVLALLRVYGLRFVALVAVKAIHGVLAVAAPTLLLKAIVEYSQDATASAVRGLFCALVVAISGVLVALLQRHFDYLAAELALFVHSSVSTAVFKHTLVVSPSTLQRTASDDVIGFVTTDAIRVQQGLLTLLDTVGTVAQLVIGGLLLHGLVGNALWAGFVAAVIGVGSSVMVAKIVRKYDVAVLEARDERVQLSQELLAGIKTLKLLTWENSFAERVVELRDDELRGVKAQLTVQGAKGVLATAVPIMVTIATLTAYVYLVGGPMKVATTLPAIMLLLLLTRDPLRFMPKRAARLRDALTSLWKLNTFLVEPVRVMAEEPHPTNGPSVAVKNADFKWDTTTQKTELDLLLEAQGILENPVSGPVLHHINFYASPGQLHAVVGARESGKSSFLAGIVGLVRCSAGEVSVQGSVAYVSCDPFLLTTTIRENICFGQPYEAHRYVMAIKASCLKYDWATLPQGDRTVVGSGGGAVLTASQRIRIALARSLYQNADVYVFDDILANMEALVAKKIFKKCMQTALKSKIVIMSTLSLKVVKRATNIVVLARGTVVESGDYKALIANKKWGLLSEVIDAQSSAARKADEMGNDGADSSDEADNDSGDEEIPTQLHLAEFAPVVGEHSLEQRVVDEDSSDDNVRTAVALWLLRALGTKGYVVFGLLIALHLATAVFQLSSVAAIGKIGVPGALLEAYIAFSVLVILSIAVSTAASNLGAIHASQSVHQSLIERLSRAPLAFFDATPTNRVVAPVTKDLNVVDVGLASSWPRLFSAGAHLIVTVCVLMTLSPWLIFVLAPLILGFYRLEECFGTPTRDIERLHAASTSPVQSCVAEVLRGMTAIRIYRADHIFLERFHERMELNHQAFIFKACAKSWLGVRVDALFVVLISCASLAAVHVHTSTEASAIVQAGKVGVALIFAFTISPILFDVIKACDETWYMLLAGGRIKAYTKMPIEAALETIPQLRPTHDWPSADAIEFDNVSLRYRQGLPRILRGVTFSVASGSNLAIIGNPGSGKKSIFAALSRVVEPATGAISIDAVDIGKIGLHDLRSKIAVLTPDPTLFVGSIRSNLDATHRFTDDEIWTVIKAVGLQGAVLSLDEVVNEQGSNYSGGERQLLSIARAMLRRPRVVMIDEGDAVSMSTPDTELVDQAVQQAFSGATRLTITQRVTTATNATAVMVMVNGQIAEMGTPKELQKSARSIFRSILDHWKRRDKGDRKKT